MNKNFDFNDVGKRMPYTVPDDFFATMEEAVMKRVAADKSDEPVAAPATKKGTKTVTIVIRTLLAAAAAVTLFLVVQALLPKSEAQTDFDSVELAFSDLSTDDQDYYLDVYEEDDLFINETDNTEEL